MSKIFQLLIDYIENKLDAALGDKGRIGKKYPNKTKLERLILEITKYLVPVTSLLLIVTVLLRLLIVYNHLMFKFNLKENIPDLYKEAVDVKLTLLSLVTLIIIVFYVVVYVKRKPRPAFNLNSVVIMILIVLAVLTILPWTQEKLYKFVESEAFYRVTILRSNKDYEGAINILNPIIRFTDNPDTKYIAAKEMASIEAELQQYENSIEAYLGLMILSPQTITENDIIKLHEAVYSLGNELGFTEAERVLQEINNKYPYYDLNPLWLGATPTSPIWLGITPQNYSLILGGDVYNIGYESSEEYSTLKTLVKQYPNDPLADWGRIILGEYQSIADSEQESKVRDWAIYKTGLEAYLQKNFSKAITYYQQFLIEFPNHRWADDAAYRLARSYELSGNYQAALDTSMLSQGLPDGNLEYVTQPYTIALIENYFNSESLREYIDARNGNYDISQVAFLEYCFAELLMREEKYDEALVKFAEIRANYSGSEASKYVAKNLAILNKIVSISNEAYPQNRLDLAKLLITSPADWGTDEIVFYNDMYNGARTSALSNIGIWGPNWSYFEDSSDHIRAIKILDEIIQKNPNNPNAAEALYLISIAIYNLTYEYAFLPSHLPVKPKFYEEKSLGNLTQIPAGHCQDTNNISLLPCSEDSIPQKLERVAEILLTYHKDSSYAPETLSIIAIGFDNLGDYEKTISYMQAIYLNYPESTLANNAMIYVARVYVKLAQSEYDNDLLKQKYYENARNTYQLVLTRYPSGHVGDEASRELEGVYEALSNLQSTP